MTSGYSPLHSFTTGEARRNVRLSFIRRIPSRRQLPIKFMRLCASALGKKVVLPDWANDYLADLERARTPSLKNDLLMEGGIIYRKLPEAHVAEL